MIKIYDINDKLLMQAEVTSAAKREQEMSKSDYITLSFSAAEKVILPVGAYINYTYKIDKVREVTRKFLLLESYEPIQTDECSWKYTPQFQHPKMILSKTPFFIYTRNSQNVEVKQNVWSFVGTTSALAEKIKDFLNKDLMFGECGWKVIFQKVTANTVNVSFSDNDFISALTAITNAIGDNCEWHIDYDDEIIYIGKVLVGATPVVLEVGKNVGVPNISNSKESYYNAFSIFGGTRNITQVNSKGENVSSGNIRLQLDKGNGTILIDGKERSYSIDKYSTLDLRVDKIKEPLFTKVLDFSQIFPSLNTYVYNVRGRVKYVLDNNKKIPISYNADGSVKEYKTFTVWYMRLAYPTTEKVEGKTIINTTVDDGVTHYWYDFGITDNLLIKGKNIGCSFEPNFNTGALSTPLAGRGTNGDYVGFELTYHKEASSSHSSDDVSVSNFSVLAGDYEIIYQEDNEVIIPTNAAEMLIPRGESMPSLKCNITVLYNIAMADTIYYEDAQNRLLEKAKEEIVRLLSDMNNYEVKSYSDVFLEDNPQLQIGQNVTYKDGHGYELATRVLKLSTNIDFGFVQTITLGNQVIKGTITQLKEDVQTIIASGGSSGNGGGYSVSQLRNLIAKYGSDNFLSKQFDDIANGTITFQKVQKFVSGLFVGNFNAENGGSWTPDTEGRSHLITDYLEVRMKAIFEELVIKKTSTIGGKEIISPAGGVVAHKVEEVTVTYNNVSQKAYRCYFLAEQEGDAVDNDFAIGDQVRSESFNVRKGTYHKVGNHFYWRLVIGRDEDPVGLEGKKYHYIDLSDTDCATASDVPAKGDVLSQCGNRTDVERQNCLIFSAVDTYSPSISLYHGINSYSFANREYVQYGVNKQTNKAFFNVYGDMYVGDRPTKENGYEGSSYIKYDSATKQVSVKGKISAKSTVDGKELSQYIKENSAKGLTEEQVNNLIKNSQVITDLQNQVDGAIETWFYEGVPTLNNAPASSWATDKEKETHLGDLYYDNKTGKAYRFAKDGNTYKWTIIADTDIAKALSDASKAQETADGKMKVFSTQPTPPYQLGDIWVNATYPTDGSIYKNEVLRCQTNKAAGSQFAIADWIKASKYTDDTVANAAKAAAEKAQKAAETAQTNVTNLGKTVTSNKKAFDSYVTDGYLEPSEIAAMAQDSKRLEDAFAAAEKSYTEVKGAEVLKNTKELTDLNTAFATLTTAKKELIKYLSDISARYNAANTEEKATIVSAVGTKFTNFQSAYSAFYDKLGLANAYITRKIYGDLGVVIGDVTSLAYLKKALMDTPDTEINGGLILTSLIGLRDKGGNTTAGINGITEKSAKGGGVAAWFGGEMVDKDYNDGSKTPANTIFRFDGSGYVAGGAIWWGTDGRVHADPTSFIISEKNLGAYLTFFEPTWKSGSAGTSVADLVSLKPNAPFSKLGVSGDATFEGAITFHGIKLTYDATNKAIKIDGNLYATGGITAYGAGTSTSTGGGLNGSVKSYSDALKLTSESLSEVASAYSIKALSRRIDNIATELGGLSLSWDNITGKPSTFAPSAHTHKWTEITDRITKVSQLTNDSGYTKNTGTVTSVSLTLPAGLTCATKTITTSGTFAISLASGYSIPTTAKQTAWDSAYDWYALMTTDEETADGIINKWNEVVSFLANIAQTDTLSGIVDGINKSISDEVARAKKAEGVNASGISANKGSIATLQGYFTNGSAKKALQLTNARKLWGNSFNGTADINGSIIVPSGKYISIGNIKLEYDAANKALKITNTTTEEVANLYTSGGVSAYGAGTSSSSGGGGLNGSVKAYNDALKLTSESLSEIASAYSIKQLSARITSLEGGSATSISVSGSGNAVTSVTKNGTTISVVKGSTFLTSHQILDHIISTDKRSTVLSPTSYLRGVYPVFISNTTDGLLDGGDYHGVLHWRSYGQSADDLSGGYPIQIAYTANGRLWTRIATSSTTWGAWKKIARTEDIPTKLSQLTNDKGYLTSHQSLAGYATQDWVNSKGYITSSGSITGNAATATHASSADYIRSNGLPTPANNTVKAYKDSLVKFFKDFYPNNGVGANVNVSASIIRNWSDDSATLYSTSTYCFIKIGGAYDGTRFGQFLLSSYNLERVGIVGRTDDKWTAIKWLAYTDDIPKNNNQLTNGAGYITSAGSCKYATSAGNAETVDGYHATMGNNKPWGTIPVITAAGGYMDIGKHLEFHYDNTTGSDYSTVLACTGNHSNIVNLPSGSGTLALTTDNVYSATKLQTARSLWGNSFNGTSDINGSIIVPSGKYISIGNIKMEYDATNKALKITNTMTNEVANLYTSGGVSAYGVGTSSSSGGGLNGSVKSYSDALKLTSESLSEIASAYSIKALASRISSLEGGSATSISVSGSGNAVTSVTKNGTTISVVKGSTFSLSGHTHKWADITDRPSSLKNPSALSWSGYSSGSYDGSAAKSISIPNNTNQLTNGAGFITASASITGNAATATKVNHSLSVFGKSFNGSADVTVADTDLIASISTATANLTDKTEILTSYASDNGFNDSNSKNRIYRRPASAIWGYINSKTISNADKLDNVHLNGIFTALSNTNNGVSMTIGTVAKSLANMQVYSATKLVTARNIALNGDLMGNANFDGSANITINGYMSYCNATVSNTNTYPWRRIAKVNELTGNYSDGCILLYISEGFNGGYYGIARVYIRTDNLSTGANASCSIQWISRNGYGLDSLKIAMYKTTGKAYYDVFLKMRGAYASVVIRTLQDQRGGLGKRFTLVNSTETTNAASHTEAYATIEDAATAIHNQAYTSIAQGSDVATVHNADMVDGIHASGLFTNLSNSGNSLSITVGGTNKKLTVNYASNAGNADTLDGVHASGLFTNLSNSGNNISITIGGTNKTLTVGYATKAAQLNTARTLWGQSFDGTGNVNGTLINTNSAGSETIIRCSNTNGQIDLLTSVNRGVYDRTKTRWLIGTNGANSWLDCGNVGIGTNAPAYKLDVSGDARATNFRGALVGNAATATKLQTARTIWGQSFNGTANVSGSITGVNNITMSNNSYLYGKNTGGTAIQLIAMASWNSVDIGRGALTYGYTTQVMGKTVALTASDDSGKNTKSVELSTAKFYSNVNIETEGGLLAHGGVTAYSSSDIRLKQDLRKLDYFGIIKAMGGTFGFAWKKDNTRSIGWIAQHVLCNPHLKDIVETDEKGYYKINYWSPKLIATAFGAIEQVGDEVSSLKARVVFLESEVQRLSGKQGSSNKKRLDNKNINLLN